MTVAALAVGLVGCYAVSVLAHEGGHLLAGRLLGHPARLGFGRLGPCTIVGTAASRFSRRERGLIAGAGPAVTVALLALAVAAGWPLVAFVQLDLLVLACWLDFRDVARALRGATTTTIARASR